MAQQLNCPLPPLERGAGELWIFPRGWTTVWDLADHVCRYRATKESPSRRVPDEWYEAQVFIGVRRCLIEALNVPRDRVVRSARLTEDLGAE